MRCIGVSADASENRERAPKTIRGAVAGASRAARGLLFFAVNRPIRVRAFRRPPACRYRGTVSHRPDRLRRPALCGAAGPVRKMRFAFRNGGTHTRGGPAT